MSMLFDPRPFNGGKGVLILRCEQCGGEMLHVSCGLVCENGCGKVQSRSVYGDWIEPVNWGGHRKIGQRPLREMCAGVAHGLRMLKRIERRENGG